MLALLSSGAVCLFNSSLIKLSELLLTENFMGTDEKANYAAYVLDSFTHDLDPEEKPYENLVETFLI